MTEEWRDIPGFPLYEVSDIGRVRSYHGYGKAGRSSDPRLLKLGNNRGYPTVQLKNADGKVQGKPVHRLVALAFLPDTWFEGALVRHLDDVPDNNTVGNLAWGTPFDNTQDRIRNKGLGVSRTPENITEIRRAYRLGFSQREIARVFQTTQSYVHAVVTGKQRKDVA